MTAGNWIQAVDEATAVLANHPTSAKAWAYLGWSYAQLGQLEESIEPLRKAIVLEPHFWQASFQVAQILDRLGRYPEALQHAREALRDKPGHDPIESLIRGLERQVPEELTDAWQLSSKPIYHTVLMGVNDDPEPVEESEEAEDSDASEIPLPAKLNIHPSNAV